ncbi:hypothetical protein GLOIN_2v341738 [Rhizophagus irregularis DAOM 181602=DAOM 197198]|uniref:Uncharacterized protein n=1 Tax=Rhizophagus irregularis (strain DAOM 181602 / DAOM 197198 / MUCL 43194) TaxID=747089 RepID=U9SU89_RHIID|nr:hypothetical protein GLOIN_2v341738 [Rhizophagus irregularis DAOM 181602=DAOM 197198]POG66648.1 hypothetical protein GLOIN_2v341738 [Rhizophagus irregularis DAOM 181602=DAOM 197198]GBC40829.1 hypothetical protein GLOIN_2v341738 [Rhizophagus irregularis DAOM 181602=DAOM 197198]|eukprot:XP_025173514.1 hypothetical protein GLOIN_2v341738 [Rhizophagus irregularis DAOM 181602=DAOM 197198]
MVKSYIQTFFLGTHFNFSIILYFLISILLCITLNIHFFFNCFLALNFLHLFYIYKSSSIKRKMRYIYIIYIYITF